MFSGAVFAPLSGAAPGSPLRHSAKRCATSPAGGAKCTCVNRGKVCGKAKPKKLRLTTKFSSVHGRALGSPSGRAGAKRLRGEPPTRAGEVPPQAVERAKNWPQRSDQPKKKSARFRALWRLRAFPKIAFCPIPQTFLLPAGRRVWALWPNRNRARGFRACGGRARAAGRRDRPACR